MNRRMRLTLSLAGVLVAVAAGARVVYAHRASGFWDWPGWQFFVAIGTVGLAAVTFLLALKTSKLAEDTRALGATAKDELEAMEEQIGAAREQARIAQVSYEHGLRPVLLEPLQAFVTVVNHPARGVLATVVARNCGGGIAFLRGATLCLADGVYRWEGSTARRTLPVDETVQYEFPFPSTGEDTVDTTALLSASGFSVRFVYDDLAGNVWATRFDIRADSTGVPSIYYVCVKGEERAPPPAEEPGGKPVPNGQ